jgi:ubiquinone/menaquinone biosynthesis C-methylase UbiE
MVEHEKAYWSKYAREYDRRGEYVVGTAILEAIARTLSREQDLGEVVEFGCGTGYFTKAIAGSAKHVIATDLSDEMLEVARVQLREFDKVTVEKADAGHTAFPSGRFDSVLMANLIHVIENPVACLRESHRILRDGGLLLLVDFTGYGMHWSERAKLGVRYVSRFGIPPRYTKHRLSPDELASLAERAGFRVEAVHLIEENTNALYLRGRK